MIHSSTSGNIVMVALISVLTQDIYLTIIEFLPDDAGL